MITIKKRKLIIISISLVILGLSISTFLHGQINEGKSGLVKLTVRVTVDDWYGFRLAPKAPIRIFNAEVKPYQKVAEGETNIAGEVIFYLKPGVYSIETLGGPGGFSRLSPFNLSSDLVKEVYIGI